MELLPFQISQIGLVIMLPLKADTYENSMAAQYILKQNHYKNIDTVLMGGHWIMNVDFGVFAA